MAAKKRKPPPTYTPQTAARRASGQIAIRIAPELADKARRLGAQHPGGVSGLIGALIEAAPEVPPTTTPVESTA